MLETALSDFFETVRQPNTFQVLTASECVALDPLQCGRQFHVLNRAALEDSLAQLPVLRAHVRPKHLEPLAEFHRLEVLALAERRLGDSSERCRKRHASEPALPKGAEAYRLELTWELHVPQVLALAERIYFDGPQRRRQADRLQRALLEALLPDVLELIWQGNASQALAALEGVVLDSLQCGRQLNALQCALLEHPVVHFAVLRVLVRPEYLEALVQNRLLEPLAVAERVLVDNPHGRWNR